MIFLFPFYITPATLGLACSAGGVFFGRANVFGRETPCSGHVETPNGTSQMVFSLPLPPFPYYGLVPTLRVTILTLPNLLPS